MQPALQDGGGKLGRRLLDGKLGSSQHAVHVGVELRVPAGQESLADAEQHRKGPAFLVVAGALLGGERADELVDDLQGDHHQGRVHPQRKPRVAGAVERASRKAANGDRQPALHPPVDPADPGRGRGGLLPIAKGDREGGVQDGAEPAQRVGSEATVCGYTGRDQRVRKLQQHRCRSAQQQRPLAPDPPDLRPRPPQAGVTRCSGSLSSRVLAELQEELFQLVLAVAGLLGGLLVLQAAAQPAGEDLEASLVERACR
jgi:hypothetical protein